MAHLDQNIGRGEGKRRVVFENKILHVGADTAHHSDDEDENPCSWLVVLVPRGQITGTEVEVIPESCKESGERGRD